MSIIDDFADEVFQPSTLLRLAPFGWPALFFDMYQAWGWVGKAAEAGSHLLPGLVQGQSFTDAFMADYGVRLKLAGSVLLAAAIAPASAAASGALAGVTGVSSKEIDKKIAQALQIARDKLGNAFVDAITKRVAEQMDQIDASLRSAIPEVSRVLSDPAIRSQLHPGTIAQDLERLDRGPAFFSRTLGIRQDVAAMAINVALGTRVYPMSPQAFDLASGAMIFPPAAVDRSDGKNSAWALVDLLEGQKAGVSPQAVASLQDDLDRAQRVENLPGTSLDPGDILIEILKAENRSADSRYVADLRDKFDVASRREPKTIAIKKVVEMRRAREEAARRQKVLDAGGVIFRRDDRSGGVLEQLFTLSILTAPAWGTFLWRRYLLGR